MTGNKLLKLYDALEAKRGVSGVRLPTTKIGGRRFVLRSDLEQFLLQIRGDAQPRTGGGDMPRQKFDAALRLSEDSSTTRGGKA